ncbi:MAG: hypothetical protein IK133_00590 [Clostridia bacterium]|nr:hypothetical protein [Clostridia bacterium]
MKKTCILLLLAFIFLACSRACSEAEERGRVLVALGDSYIAGEGIEPYYGQDAPIAEKCKNPDWLAHRSESAWPGMLRLPGVEGVLAEHRNENYFLVAASGAKTDQLFLLTEAEINNGRTAELEKVYNRDGVSGTAMLEPQLAVFDKLDERGLKADYVVIMIGGNDVDFRGIITMSVFGQTKALPGETNIGKGLSFMEQQYETGNVRNAIKRALHDIASRAGEQACILVVGYPCPLIDDTADGVFSKDSAMILNEATFFYCIELINLVDECRSEGMNICYVGVNNVFEGHGAYSEDPYIHPIMLLAGKQDLDSKAIVNSGSLHPNLKGAEAYARCVQDAIDQLEAGSERYIFDLYGLKKE